MKVVFFFFLIKSLCLVFDIVWFSIHSKRKCYKAQHRNICIRVCQMIKMEKFDPKIRQATQTVC